MADMMGDVGKRGQKCSREAVCGRDPEAGSKWRRTTQGRGKAQWLEQGGAGRRTRERTLRGKRRLDVGKRETRLGMAQSSVSKRKW